MRLDHLVLAVPSLADGVAGFQRRTGVRPVKGGSHTSLGTANYLVGLSDAAYLEIIGPDPDQPDPGRPRHQELCDVVGTQGGGRIIRSCILNGDVRRLLPHQQQRVQKLVLTLTIFAL